MNLPRPRNHPHLLSGPSPESSASSKTIDGEGGVVAGSIWQLDLAGRQSPWWNMAIDRRLLHRWKEGSRTPILRLYLWDRPTITLGRHQDPERDGIDLAACRERGVSVVRRPTGGRAVYHGEGLTYAVVAPIPHGHASVAECYRWCVGGLLAGLRSLSLPVSELGRQGGSEERSLRGACYAAPSLGEVALAGGKWIGSAQRRLGRAFLQHGSIPLVDDSRRLADCMRFEDEGQRQRWAAALSKGTATVSEWRGDLTAEMLAAVIQEGWQAHHGVSYWHSPDLGGDELIREAEEFRNDPFWTPVA